MESGHGHAQACALARRLERGAITYDLSFGAGWLTLQRAQPEIYSILIQQERACDYASVTVYGWTVYQVEYR
jgi:hypothetical protein